MSIAAVMSSGDVIVAQECRYSKTVQHWHKNAGTEMQVRQFNTGTVESKGEKGRQRAQYAIQYHTVVDKPPAGGTSRVPDQALHPQMQWR